MSYTRKQKEGCIILTVFILLIIFFAEILLTLIENIL